MSECGENLLVDVSEILFNELAFFRLMQNLDTANAKVKEQLRTFAKVARLLLWLISKTARKWKFCLQYHSLFHHLTVCVVLLEAVFAVVCS